jgi:hypothetical protein
LTILVSVAAMAVATKNQNNQVFQVFQVARVFRPSFRFAKQSSFQVAPVSFSSRITDGA